MSTKKLARNQPCPCGSGRKYKRCCEPKDIAAKAANQPKGIKLMQPKEKPKNTFRREVEAANISDAELMYRDQCVMLMEMENHKSRVDADVVHYRSAIETRETELIAFKNLPACEAKQPAIEACKEHIKMLNQSLENCLAKFPRAAVVQMEALKRVVAMGVGGALVIDNDGKTSSLPEGDPVLQIDKEGNIKPVNQKPPGERITQTKPMEKDGPIQTDGGGADDDDDDEDEDDGLAEPEPEDKTKTETAIVTP